MGIGFVRRLTMVGAAMVLVAGCASATPSASPGGSSPSPSPANSAAASPSAAAASAAASAAAASFDPSLLPPPETTVIKYAEGGIDPDTSAVAIADKAGLLEKYGLTGQSYQFNGAAQVIQALIAKQLNVAVSTSSKTILSLGTSDPAVDIAVLSTRLPDYLYAAKGITSGADVKGKKAAVSTLGSQAYQEVVVGLEQLGLQPSDVTIVPIGGQSARVSALESGAVAVAAADPGLADKLAPDGITPLVKLPDLPNVELAGANVMLLRSFVDANPNTTLRLAAAVLEAVHLEVTDESKVVQLFADYAQISTDQSQKNWDAYLNSGVQQTLYASDNAYKTAQDVLVPLSADVANFDVSKAHDFSFLDKLKQMGLYSQLGIPTN